MPCVTCDTCDVLKYKTIIIIIHSMVVEHRKMTSHACPPSPVPSVVAVHFPVLSIQRPGAGGRPAESVYRTAAEPEEGGRPALDRPGGGRVSSAVRPAGAWRQQLNGRFCLELVADSVPHQPHQYFICTLIPSGFNESLISIWAEHIHTTCPYHVPVVPVVPDALLSTPQHLNHGENNLCFHVGETSKPVTTCSVALNMTDTHCCKGTFSLWICVRPWSGRGFVLVFTHLHCPPWWLRPFQYNTQYTLMYVVHRLFLWFPLSFKLPSRVQLFCETWLPAQRSFITDVYVDRASVWFSYQPEILTDGSSFYFVHISRSQVNQL